MELILITGPAGSGKSTFASSFQNFLSLLQKPCLIFNLDPANESLPYTPDIDICDLITLDDACAATDLGPNGGLIYCMDFILQNIAWIHSKLSVHKSSLILIDLPGQIELFTQHPVLVNIIQNLTQKFSCKAMAINLIDCNLCTQPNTFIAACLMSLSVMTHLELPHLNVLSKIDMLKEFYKDLRFNLEFYTDVSELSRVVDEEQWGEKMAKIAKKLAEVVEDFGLVGFQLLSVNDKDTMMSLVRQIGRTLGSRLVYQEEFADFVVAERVAAVEERYCKDDSV